MGLYWRFVIGWLVGVLIDAGAHAFWGSPLQSDTFWLMLAFILVWIDHQEHENNT